MTIRVLLADDQSLIRTALQMVITDTDDIEVAGEATSRSPPTSPSASPPSRPT